MPEEFKPSPLIDMLAAAQVAEINAVYLDAGRIEHIQLAQQVQKLAKLALDIRATATRSVPNCINLAAIDRLISNATNA